ncbi:MAG: TylF/MycF/NovP-related O-methyltransferase [Gaiellaceae bacterium]
MTERVPGVPPDVNRSSDEAAEGGEDAARLRLKEKNAALRARLAELEAARLEQKTARLRLKEESAALRAHLAELAAERDRLAGEVAELGRSYYLSGARKKLDLRELPGFSQIACRIATEGRAGMHYDRLYTLWQAVRAAPDAAIVEIGVYRGGSAKFIAETLRQAGRTPRVYACDTFRGHASTDAIDGGHHTLEKFLDTSSEEVGEYLSSYPNLELLVGDIEETSARLADERFGFVHVDVDVYGATSFCLRFFAPRLAPGAVIVVDDYGFVTCPGAKQAVDEFITENGGFRLFHLLTGQAILFRISNGSG